MAINSASAFSRNVKTLLEVTGVTQTELAGLCDIPNTRISEIIAGKYGQNFRTLDLICSGFNKHFGEAVIRPDAMVAEKFKIPARICPAAGRRK